VNSTHTTNPKGFTLLEILIAMFIFAVVLSTIYSSYTGTHRIMDETESQADIYMMARVSLERMQEDLESVYHIPPKGDKPPESDKEEGAFVGEDNEIEGRSTDSLHFVSRAHLVFSEQEQSSATAEIAYYVKENEEEEGFILYRSDSPTFQEEPEEETGGLVLCDSLMSVNFTYYDEEGEEYDNWDSTSDEFKHKVPKRVSIELEFENSTDPERPFSFMTSVALPLARAAQG
jgi:general secretion pathway protein J